MSIKARTRRAGRALIATWVAADLGARATPGAMCRNHGCQMVRVTKIHGVTPDKDKHVVAQRVMQAASLDLRSPIR